MSAPLIAFLDKELAHTLIDYPKQTFRQTVSHLIHQLTSLQKFLTASKESGSLQQLWDEKVALWSAQNSMACRFLHIDKDNPLLHHLLETWRARSDGACSLETLPLNEVREALKQKFPVLRPFSSELKSRLWVLAHYLWHTQLAAPRSTGCERFVTWHTTLHPEISNQALDRCLREAVPFMSLRP